MFNVYWIDEMVEIQGNGLVASFVVNLIKNESLILYEMIAMIRSVFLLVITNYLLERFSCRIRLRIDFFINLYALNEEKTNLFGK